MDEYNVLVLLGDKNTILSVDSSAFLSDTKGWVKIDAGTSDRCRHAQNNYLPKSKYDERGIPRYAYVPDGDPKWRERTKEEMDVDYVPPVVKPSAEELLDALMEGIEDA